MSKKETEDESTFAVLHGADDSDEEETTQLALTEENAQRLSALADAYGGIDETAVLNMLVAEAYWARVAEIRDAVGD